MPCQNSQVNCFEGGEESHSVTQVDLGLGLSSPPASASLVLRLQALTTRLTSIFMVNPYWRKQSSERDRTPPVPAPLGSGLGGP